MAYWRTLATTCLLAVVLSCAGPGGVPGPAGGPTAGQQIGTVNEAAPAGAAPGTMGATGPAAEKATDGSVKEDAPSNQPGPGGSLPSGNPAPVVDYDGGWMCLNARYQSLCKEGFEKRVRIELKGKVTSSNNDPTACAFNGKRALRIIYPTGEGGPASLKHVDVPVAEDGQAEVMFSPSDPASMDYYLVPKEQDSVTEERSCAHNVCIDADLNGVQDANRCKVITQAFLCDRDSPPPHFGDTIIEIHPHNQGPLTECQQFFIKEMAPMEIFLAPALKNRAIQKKKK